MGHYQSQKKGEIKKQSSSTQPLPYQDIVIPKMEKIENLDEVVKDTVIMR